MTQTHMHSQNDDIFLDPTPSDALRMTEAEMQADAAGMPSNIIIEITVAVLYSTDY